MNKIVYFEDILNDNPVKHTVNLDSAYFVLKIPAFDNMEYIDFYDLQDNKIKLNKNIKHDIEVVIDRLMVKKGIKDRLTGSMELALKVGNGLVIINEIGKQVHLVS